MCINGVVHIVNGFYNVDREGPAWKTHRAEDGVVHKEVKSSFNKNGQVISA